MVFSDHILQQRVLPPASRKVSLLFSILLGDVKSQIPRPRSLMGFVEVRVFLCPSQPQLLMMGNPFSPL